MDQYQLFKDYEVMSVSCTLAGLLYGPLGQPWATYGLIVGFVAALFYHRFGGTYQSYLNDLYPRLGDINSNGSHLHGRGTHDHAA